MVWFVCRIISTAFILACFGILEIALFSVNVESKKCNHHKCPHKIETTNSTNTTSTTIKAAKNLCDKAPNAGLRRFCLDLESWTNKSRADEKDSQSVCAKAPNEGIRKHCLTLQLWTKQSMASPAFVSKTAVPPQIPGRKRPVSAGLTPVATTPYPCMDLGCMCPFFGGNGTDGSNNCTLANGQPLGKAIRIEYRLLTDNQRTRFHEALNTLKQSGVFDQLAAIHSSFAMSSSAHGGCGFHPWHREFIKRYEIALRLIDPTLVLPYWDSTCESYLANPRDSVMFTDELMGGTERSGSLTGTFSWWRTASGRPIQRNVGGSGMYTNSDIDGLINNPDYTIFLSYTAPPDEFACSINFDSAEFIHGGVHTCVGGDMSFLVRSAYDPIFYLHHSFVDYIWELWRQRHPELNNQYCPDSESCETPKHFRDAPMSPFDPFLNVDGLSEKYTGNLFEYGPRPNCSMVPACGSKYLFCDNNNCIAKIRPGGNCQRYKANRNCCYLGTCRSGRCQGGISSPAKKDQPLPLPPTNSSINQISSIYVSCYNEHECCAIWASKGECGKDPAYMKTWCKPSCYVCEPNYYLKDDCSDRHIKCSEWAAEGKCRKNDSINFMNENCRKTCNNLYRTTCAPRKTVCS